MQEKRLMKRRARSHSACAPDRTSRLRRRRRRVRRRSRAASAAYRRRQWISSPGCGHAASTGWLTCALGAIVVGAGRSSSRHLLDSSREQVRRAVHSVAGPRGHASVGRARAWPGGSVANPTRSAREHAPRLSSFACLINVAQPHADTQTHEHTDTQAHKRTHRVGWLFHSAARLLARPTACTCNANTHKSDQCCTLNQFART